MRRERHGRKRTRLAHVRRSFAARLDGQLGCCGEDVAVSSDTRRIFNGVKEARRATTGNEAVSTHCASLRRRRVPAMRHRRQSRGRAFSRPMDTSARRAISASAAPEFSVWCRKWWRRCWSVVSECVRECERDREGDSVNAKFVQKRHLACPAATRRASKRRAPLSGRM